MLADSRARNLKTAICTLTAVVLLAPGLAAQMAEPEPFPPAVEPRPSTPPPLGLAGRAAVPPLAFLDPATEAAPEELADLARWNRERRGPLKNGFSRPLPEPRAVTLEPALLGPRLRGSASSVELEGGVASKTAAGDLIWGAEVTVEGAYRLRLHLHDVDLPPGSLLWVYNDLDERVGPLEVRQLLFANELWTPPLAGPSLRLELLLPAQEPETGGSFVVDRVLEVFPLDADGAPLSGPSLAETGAGCLVDAQCVGSATFGPIENVQRAIAMLTFVDGGSGYLCSGGLLNDTDNQTTIPYLLTANHCISKQSVAATVTAYFDLWATSCGGPANNFYERSDGSTLLATGSASSSSDFTLLRLESLPPNRFLLGWDASSSAISSGKILHRISHPDGRVQHYSQTRVDTTSTICETEGGTTLPRSRFIYSSLEIGDTIPGSSGSPVMLANGKVVGQLLGSCGPQDAVDCDPRVDAVDGAFSRTWSQVEDYLDPVKYTLTVNKNGNGAGTVTSTPSGIDCGATCSAKYVTGTEVQLTATPAGGSSFAGWSGACNAGGEVTMSSNKTCTATFSRPVLTITKTGTGQGGVTTVPLGISCGATCAAAFDLGTTVELLASAALDSAFDGWSGHADCADALVSMNADKGCTASFRLLPTYTLSVTKEGEGFGTVRSDPGAINCGSVCEDDFVEGKIVRLLAIPELGSQLGAWSGDSDCEDGFLTMVADRSCTGSFVPCTIDSEVVVSAPSEPVTDARLYQACNVLILEEGGFVIANGGEVALRAGNLVALPSGFVVETGGRLEVIIGPPLPEP